MAKAYIGTSGWVYKSWEKEFYPPGVPVKNHFQYYVTRFSSVEINATFYRLPTLNMVRGWRDRAPPGFVFALKGSRFITHIKRLADLSDSLAIFFRLVRPMKSRVGPILWQLPPSFKKDLGRLESFAGKLPAGYRHAFEFRHESWFDAEVDDALRRRNIARVTVSSLRFPMDFTVTADFIYLRFHGLEGGSAHDYTRAELEPWATHILRQTRAGRDAYAYFNNDTNVRAPGNALLLMDLAGPSAARPLTGEYAGPLKKRALPKAA